MKTFEKFVSGSAGVSLAASFVLALFLSAVAPTAAALPSPQDKGNKGDKVDKGERSGDRGGRNNEANARDKGDKGSPGGKGGGHHDPPSDRPRP